jgi:hypothetical protein
MVMAEEDALSARTLSKPAQPKALRVFYVI